MKFFWIGLGGCLGSIARYAAGVWIYSRYGTRFPYGTFVINITGCFLIGLVYVFLDTRVGLPEAWRYAVPIGFIGAYTTFSTFELETFRAAQSGHTSVALLNIGLSVLIGYLAVWLGVITGRLFA
jgi:CrcB protein